jgi:hypothetical protein
MQHPQNFSTARHEGRYAICSYELHGLSIVDYALLAQLAYFDSEKEDFHRLFSALFRFPKDFQLRMPPIKNRKKGHAQVYKILKVISLLCTIIIFLIVFSFTIFTVQSET